MSAPLTDISEAKHKDGLPRPESDDTIDSEHDDIEQNHRRESVEDEEIVDEDKRPTRPELTRAPSTALSRVSSRLTTHSLPDPGPPPDGGPKAWTQIAMGWIAIACTWGYINCFGVFQTYYTLNLDVSPSTFSWIGTVQVFLTFIVGVPSGRLLDAGYFLPTVITGVTLQVLGIFMTSLSTKYWQLMLTQGVLVGVGGGIFFTPCMGVTATWFSKRRSFAMGIASTGNSFGGMVYPIIVRELLPKLGFAWTVRVIGFFNMALLACVVALMRPRLPPRPSDALIDFSAFRELPFSFFVIGVFFQTWNIYYTLYYVSSFGVEALKMSFSKAAILLIIVNGIGVPARLCTSFAADKTGQMNLLVPLSWVFTIIVWSWIAVRNVAGLYVFVCFYGITVAALQCLFPPTVAALTSDLRVIGTRLGMWCVFMGAGALTGPPIGGGIQGAQNGDYTGAQAWAASSTLICAGFFTLARMLRAEWKLWVKV